MKGGQLIVDVRDIYQSARKLAAGDRTLEEDIRRIIELRFAALLVTRRMQLEHSVNMSDVLDIVENALYRLVQDLHHVQPKLPEKN